MDTRSMEKSAGWSETSDCLSAKRKMHENGAKAERGIAGVETGW